MDLPLIEKQKTKANLWNPASHTILKRTQMCCGFVEQQNREFLKYFKETNENCPAGTWYCGGEKIQAPHWRAKALIAEALTRHKPGGTAIDEGNIRQYNNLQA